MEEKIVKKEELDSELAEIVPEIKDKSANSKSFVLELRKARNVEYNYSSVNLSDVKQEIGEITHSNREIERAVKLEVLGIKEDTLSEIMYLLKTFGRKFEPAESLIRQQLGRVNSFSLQIEGFAEHLERRLVKLEERYDTVLSGIIRRYEENGEISGKLGRVGGLLTKTSAFIESLEDPAERLRYARAQRQIRKSINSGTLRQRLNEKAISLLRVELPILDGLSFVGAAYSNTLKEISQEANMMSGHLETVMSLYLDIMRTRRINFNLGGEIAGLFNYAERMHRALEIGSEEVVRQAQNASIVQSNYLSNARSLSRVVGKVEDATFSEMHELERRLSDYKAERRSD